MEAKEVNVLENGPILVKDANDKNVAFCRCGQTENSPFCDGSHVACNFVGRTIPEETEEPNSE